MPDGTRDNGTGKPSTFSTPGSFDEPGPLGQELAEKRKREAAPLTVRRPSEILGMKFSPTDLLWGNGYLAKGDPIAICGRRRGQIPAFHATPELRW